MEVRTSQFNPEHEIPEKSWAYRLVKRFLFNDFGAYQNYDHSDTAAPFVLKSNALKSNKSSAEQTETNTLSS